MNDLFFNSEEERIKDFEELAEENEVEISSDFKDWLIKEGFDQLYGKTIPIKHYVLYCTEHIIDVLAPEGITPVILYK